MKTITKSVLIAGVAGLAVTTMFAKSSGGGGQPEHNIRFSFKVAFTNTGADTNLTNPSGSATGSESMSTKSDRESLSVTLKGLEPSAPYSLSGTAGGTKSDVADFTTDKKGGAKITVSSKPGKKGFAIDSLDPLTGVTELDIVDDTSSNAVLTVDTTTPKTFTFMDTQTITSSSSSNTVTGSLNVSASTRSSKLTLKVGGLQSGDTYALSLTGVTASSNITATASSKGTVTIKTPIPSDVLDLTEVDLTDTTTPSNPGLVFTMP